MGSLHGWDCEGAPAAGALLRGPAAAGCRSGCLIVGSAARLPCWAAGSAPVGGYCDPAHGRHEGRPGDRVHRGEGGLGARAGVQPSGMASDSKAITAPVT
jgi:hypothetical protein